MLISNQNMKTLHLNPKEILWNVVFGAATKKKKRLAKPHTIVPIS
jgi:hypothetical protein